MIPTTEGRIELKYALPVTERGRVLAAAAPYIVPGQHTRDLSDDPDVRWTPGELAPHGYRVHSLYLDAPTLDGYGRRLAMARIRNRIRIRTYGRIGSGPAPVFLEAKRKLHERVVKHRVLLCDLPAWEAGPADAPWRTAIAALPEGPTRAHALRWQEVAEGRREQGSGHGVPMVPVTVTHYVREVWEEGRTRLTLDHSVQASPGEDMRAIRVPGTHDIIPSDWLVLELKFNGAMPGWMRQLIRTLHLQSEPISKFGLGVARTLRGDRPQELHALIPPSMLHSGRGMVGAWPALDARPLPAAPAAR